MTHPPPQADSRHSASRPEPRRSLLAWWPLATGLALGAFSLATDDPQSVDGALLTLLIPTCAYALIALVGTPSLSWPLTGLVVLVLLGVEALGFSGPLVLVGVVVAAVLGGAASGRWRPPPVEMLWQPWAALVFLTSVVAGLLLDVTAAKVVIAVGLLAHGTWDIVLWRRRAVVARSLAEWCAALDLSLGLGVLALVALA